MSSKYIREKKEFDNMCYLFMKEISILVRSQIITLGQRKTCLNGVLAQRNQNYQLLTVLADTSS